MEALMLPLTIIEDRESFDDVSTAEVRRQFRLWREEAGRVEQEQGTGKTMARNQRYKYCVMVDWEVLESVVEDTEAPPALDIGSPGYVNLIKADWEHNQTVASHGLGKNSDGGQAANGNDVDDEDEEDEDEDEEEIEGCTSKDVGWMKVCYQHAMTGMYDKLRDEHRWGNIYVRPPEIARL